MSSDLEQWEEDLYNRTFDDMYFAYTRRISDNLITMDELEHMIAAEYINQGMDQEGGTGVMKQITSEATADAMARALREWKAGTIS